MGQSYGTAATAPPKLNLLRIEEDLSAAHLRLSRVNIEQLGWQDCIEKYDRKATLFYLDPPYWSTAGYGVEFGLENYTQMGDLARSIKGRMIISVNDIPEMREAFSGLHIQTLGINYTLNKGSETPRQELLIKNW